MASISMDEAFISLLRKSFPSSIPSSPSQSDFSKLSSVLYPSVTYTDQDKTEISQWLITSSHIASPSEDQAKTDQRLASLNTHLASRTTLLGSKPSVADLAIYARIAPVVSQWSPEERTGERGYHHIVRHTDFVQNAPLFELQIAEEDKVKIDPDDVRCPIKPIDMREKKKKEKEAAAAAAATAAAAGATQTSMADRTAAPEQAEGRKSKKEKKAKGPGEALAAAIGAETPGVAQPSADAPTNTMSSPSPAAAATPQPKAPTEKKDKPPKQPKPAAAAPAAEKPLSPSLIDLRVGHILKAIPHPNADSLYVSTIAVGDAPGTENTAEYERQVCRTVCSGLNGLIPLEEMQGRKVVAVCNLKPVTMRGIKSAAMVLAASPRLSEGEEDGHKGPVELVDLPEGSEAGERVWFEGWEDGEPEKVLNPKKKIWEMLQPGFTTTEGMEVRFDVGRVEAFKGEAGEGKRDKEGRLRTKEGYCTVKSLTGAIVR